MPVQGGLVTARAPKNTLNVFLNDEALRIGPDGVFLMGFDRDAPVQASVVFMLADGSKTARNISVARSGWRIENVAANMTGGAKSSAEFEARRGAEQSLHRSMRRAGSAVKATAGGKNSSGLLQAEYPGYLAPSGSTTVFAAAIIPAWISLQQVGPHLLRPRTAL